MMLHENWWESFYDEGFAAAVMDAGDDARSQQEADFLVEALQLEPGARVFDQCCGIGRLSLVLARRGFSVVGVDAIPDYIARAHAACAAAQHDAEFHAADARDFVPTPSCAGAFNAWSSFGYLHSDAENARILASAFRAIQPGGRFVLDYFGVISLLRSFREVAQFHYSGRAGSTPVTRRSRLDLQGGILEQTWEYRTADGTLHTKQSCTKLYLPHDLVRLLEGVGFRVVALHGDLEFSPVTLESPRCVVVAERPDRPSAA